MSRILSAGRALQSPRCVPGLIALAMLALLPSACLGGGIPDGWVSFDGHTAEPTPPSIEILSSGASEIVLRVRTPGVLCETVVGDETEFKRLGLLEHYHSTQVGSPLVPTVRHLIAVPAGCEIEVSFSAAETLTFSRVSLYPVPEVVVHYTDEGWEYFDYEFALDEAAYAESGLYPGQVTEVGTQGSLRGQGVALLTVYPIQYDPTREKVFALPSVVVTLRFDGGAALAGSLGPLEEIAESTLLNYEGSGSRGVRGPAGPGVWDICRSVEACETLAADYLMIVHGPLLASDYVDTLALHRTVWNGFNVAVVPDTAVIDYYQQGSISANAIRAFIKAVYDTESSAHMEDGHLGYVLLVGDARDSLQGGADELLPAREVLADGGGGLWWTTTDHRYACVAGPEGDDYPDLLLGRLCVSHVSELETEVRKYVDYERDASASQDWRYDVLLSCGFAWIGPQPPCIPGDEWKAASTHDAFEYASTVLQQHGYAEPTEVHAHEQEGANCFEQYESTRPLNVACVNAGAYFVELCCHGGHGGTYTFQYYNPGQLSNAGKLPFWASYSCGTCAFDWVPTGGDTLTDCLGERLLHYKGQNGAIGYFGSTEGSFSEGWEFLGSYVWDALLEGHCSSLGGIVSFAKMRHLSGTGRSFELLAYNLLGDPALDIKLVDWSGFSEARDFEISQTDVSISPRFPSFEDPIQFDAVVHNRSNYAPDDSVQVQFLLCERDGSECTPVDTVYVTPPARGYDTAQGSWSPSSSDEIGHRLLKVSVDPEQVVTELFEDNNEAEAAFGVFPDRHGFDNRILGVAGHAPTIAELDGGGPDVLVTSREPGKLKAYTCEGDSLWMFTAPGGAIIHGSPAVADLDGDGDCEVVVCYGSSVTCLADSTGQEIWEEPHNVPGLRSGPSIGDFIGGDGELEVAVVRTYDDPYPQECVQFLDRYGAQVQERCVARTGGELCSFRESCAAVADLDDDGHVDAAWTHMGYFLNSGRAVAVSGRTGAVLWNKDFGTWGDPVPGSDPPSIQPADPCVADVDDGWSGLETLCGGHELWCINDQDTSASRPLYGFLSGVASADLDGDGVPEIVAATYGAPGDPTECIGHLYVLQRSGGAWSAADSIALDYACTGQPVLADIDGDSELEIIVPSSCPSWEGTYRSDVSHLDIVTYVPGKGCEPYVERPLYFDGRLTSTPTVADTDDDGQLEVWLVDGEGYVHCLEFWTNGRASRWSAYQHDARHTGTYETPVSGAYPEETEASWWGDYLMTGDVLIDSTSSIVVQPGTTVRVTPYSDDAAADSLGVEPELAEFIVDGVALATGTATNPTRFIPSEYAAQPGQSYTGCWRGIRLREGSSGAFRGCLIDSAYIAIAAKDPDSLAVERCTLTHSGVIGVRCFGDGGDSGVRLRRNVIEHGQIGVELHSCAAQVDSNTIRYTKSYGVKVYEDRGTDLEWNTLKEPVGFSSFSGIYAQGSLNTLRIVGNSIWDIHTKGIIHELWASGVDEIRDNDIEGDIDSPCVKGMYFYDSNARVRGNTIDQVRIPFWVEIVGGATPDLGDASVSDGNNSTYDLRRIQYYVKVIDGPRSTVKAENNYWGTSDSLAIQSKMVGSVDWSPFLSEDPNEGRDSSEQPPWQGAIAFEFRQNHPNPFNPSTRLSFAIPEKAYVRLRLYDLAGRHVRTLVDSEKTPGWHEVGWDGTNVQGVPVASGVYFCRLEAGTHVASKKLVLLK